MTLNLLKLASQGRAFDATRPYTPKELDGLLALEKERGLDRRVAAEYIRNGIVTVEGYDKAKEAGVVPKSLEEIKDEAVQAHVASIKDELGLEDEDETEEEEKDESSEDAKGDADKEGDDESKGDSEADEKAKAEAEAKAKADAKAKAEAAAKKKAAAAKKDKK